MTRDELVAWARDCSARWLEDKLDLRDMGVMMADWHLSLATPEQLPARKVVQISSVSDASGTFVLFGLRQDGTLATWYRAGFWEDLEPIPQPAPPVDAAAASESQQEGNAI